MSFSKQKFQQFLLENQVIGFSNSPIQLKSGKQSSWYANFRILTQSHTLLEKLANFVADFFMELPLSKTDGVIGVPEGATLLGYEVQKKLVQKGLFADKIFHFRNKPKQHGAKSDKYWVNGNLPQKIILLEDVFTTGISLINFAKTLHANGIVTPLVVGLLTRQQLDSKGRSLSQVLEYFGIKHHFLTTAEQILPLALEKESQKEKIAKKIYDEYQTEYQQFQLCSPLANLQAGVKVKKL